MIIKKLFATFAGLNEAKLELKPGLNIIEGRNESGKSTWCAFLRAMLYGIDTRERDTKEKRAEKNRYRPWSGAPISGRMELEADGELVTVERSGTAASPMKNFRAYTPSGSDAGLTAENFGERMTGASREVFERSAFVSAPPLPSGSEELEARILATVSSGDDGAGYTAAEARLREWQRRLRYNRRGELPMLEARIDELRREADECREIDQRITSAESDLRGLALRREELLREVAAHDALERARAEGELSAARKRLAEAAAERAEAEKALPEGAPSAESLRRIEREYAAEKLAASARDNGAELELREVEAKIFAAVNRAQRAYGALPNEESLAGRAAAAARESAQAVRELERPVKKTAAWAFAGIAVVLALFAVGMVTFGSFELYDAAPIAVLAAGVVSAWVGAAISLAAKAKAKKLRDERAALLAKWQVVSAEALDRFADEVEALEARRGELAARVKARGEISLPVTGRLAALFGAEGGALDEALRRTVDAAERAERAAASERAAQATVAALENAGLGTGAESVDFEPTMSRAEAERRLAECESRIASLRRESAVAEGSLGGRDATLFDAEAERLDGERAALERKFEAIDAALKALAQANDAMRSRFSPALNAETAKIFAELTGGRYSRVAVSREFRPEAGGEATQLRSLDELSRGTVDQLWLALRLAVARTTLPSGTPIVLDDAFAAFDDERLETALEMLRREAADRQILVFTCHGREAAICGGMEDVNIVKL